MWYGVVWFSQFLVHSGRISTLNSLQQSDTNQQLPGHALDLMPGHALDLQSNTSLHLPQQHPQSLDLAVTGEYHHHVFEQFRHAVQHTTNTMKMPGAHTL